MIVCIALLTPGPILAMEAWLEEGDRITTHPSRKNINLETDESQNFPSKLDDLLTNKIDKQTYETLKKEASVVQTGGKFEEEAKLRLLMLSTYKRCYSSTLEEDLRKTAEAYQNCKNYSYEAHLREWILTYKEETKNTTSPYYDKTFYASFGNSSDVYFVLQEQRKQSKNLIGTARAQFNNKNYRRAAELWDLWLLSDNKCSLKQGKGFEQYVKEAIEANHLVENYSREATLRHDMLQDASVGANQEEWFKWAKIALDANPSQSTDPLNICIGLLRDQGTSPVLKEKVRALILEHGSWLLELYGDPKPPKKKFCTLI